MMPLVKLAKKLMSEGWKMVRMIRRVERWGFAVCARAMFCSSLGGVEGMLWPELDDDGGDDGGLPGRKSGRWTASGTLGEMLESVIVSVALILGVLELISGCPGSSARWFGGVL